MDDYPRINVQTLVDELYPSDFEGTIDEVLARVLQLKEKFGGSAKLNYDTYHQYDYDYNPGYGVFVLAPETDIQHETRVKALKSKDEALRAKRLKQYNALRAEFGDFK